MYSAGHADIMKHKKDVGGESMLTLDMVRDCLLYTSDAADD